MKAAVFDSFHKDIVVRDVEVPQISVDGALIRVEACGICRSDWHGWMGHDSDVRLPHVPGHELAGVVSDIGADVTKWRTGDRVTVPFCCGCGICDQCRDGCSHICDNYTQPGFTQWGAFAEFVHIRHADINLVRLPDSIDSVTAAGLGCRVATAFRGVMHQGQITADDIVAVFGCGGVGLSAVMIAAAQGARVIAVDIRTPQLKKAIACGADDVVNADQTDDVVSTIKDLTNGGVHVAIDAFGSRETCYAGIEALRKRGRHVQIGLTLGAESDPPIPMSAVIANELVIVGSHGMAAQDYPAMLGMIESGRLSPDQLVGETVSLKQGCDRLMQMDQFESVGATVIDMRQS